MKIGVITHRDARIYEKRMGCKTSNPAIGTNPLSETRADSNKNKLKKHVQRMVQKVNVDRTFSLADKEMVKIANELMRAENSEKIIKEGTSSSYGYEWTTGALKMFFLYLSDIGVKMDNGNEMDWNSIGSGNAIQVSFFLLEKAFKGYWMFSIAKNRFYDATLSIRKTRREIAQRIEQLIVEQSQEKSGRLGE